MFCHLNSISGLKIISPPHIQLEVEYNYEANDKGENHDC